MLIRLADANPKLELDLNFSDRPVDLVEDGFDLAIRNGALQAWPSLTALRIAHQHMRVCAAPRYLEAEGAPETLDDRAGHYAILYSRADASCPGCFRKVPAHRRRSRRRAACASTISARSATRRWRLEASPGCPGG